MQNNIDDNLSSVKFITVGKKYYLISIILILLGIMGIIYGIKTEEYLRIWQVYLINFLFWSGISIAGIVFSAILNITNAKWGQSIRRIAEGLGFFIPISFVLFLLLYFGREFIFPWITKPIPEKQAWLNFPFMFTRNVFGLLFLYSLSIIFLYFSIRPDIGYIIEKHFPLLNNKSRVFSRNWKGIEPEIIKSQKIKSVFSVIIIISYCVIFTILAFDLVMSLDPHWYSTLFGAYFFIGNLYLGFAVIAVYSIIIRKYCYLHNYITPKVFHDLGKLIFAFCMLTGDFFYSQFLVIWYGNLPEETRYIIARAKESPWENLSWAVLFISFVIPFIILLFRKIKVKPLTFLTTSFIIIIGMWLERFLLLVPSLWQIGGFPFGIVEVFITLGFAGLFLFITGYGLTLIPIIPLTDRLFIKN